MQNNQNDKLSIKIKDGILRGKYKEIQVYNEENDDYDIEYFQLESYNSKDDETCLYNEIINHINKFKQ